MIWCLLFHRNWKEKCICFVIYLPYLSIYQGYNVGRRHISDFKNYVLICCNLAWFITLKWLIDTTPWLKSSRFTIWTFRKLISWGTYSNAVLQLQYTSGMRIWKYLTIILDTYVPTITIFLWLYKKCYLYSQYMENEIL